MKAIPIITISWLFAGCGLQEIGRESKTKAHMNQLLSALEIFHKEFGRYPDADPESVYLGLWQGNPKGYAIYSPTERERSMGRFIDSWDRPFVFSLREDGMAIRSAGRDGVFGTTDDLETESKRIRK